VLVMKNVIVHFPEFALSSGGLRRFRRVESMGVNLDKRKVPKNETQSLSELWLKCPHHRC
jgi:hypothetical protein